MYKKTVEFKDYDGSEKTKDCWFHLKRTELLEIAMDLPEDVTDDIVNDNAREEIGHKIYETLGKKGVMMFIKNLILKSYGIRARDGKSFEKSDEITYRFSQTLAFEQLYYDIITKDEVMVEFLNAVIPTNTDENVTVV
jgi:hypothetical protein